MNPALVIGLMQAAAELVTKLAPTVQAISATFSTSDKALVDAELAKMRAAYDASFTEAQSLLRGE